MNLYKISQDQNIGYDTYDSAVVAAKSEKEARNINPNAYGGMDTWCSSPDKVTVVYLGKAGKSIKAGVICASFNAG